MKAIVNGSVIAEADKGDLIQIEGNWYFPPASLDSAKLQASPTPYTCPWKGECQYLNVIDGDSVLKDYAWSYPHPYPGAAERVGKEFADYVAFGKEVEVSE